MIQIVIIFRIIINFALLVFGLMLILIGLFASVVDKVCKGEILFKGFKLNNIGTRVACMIVGLALIFFVISNQAIITEESDGTRTLEVSYPMKINLRDR